MGRNMEIPYGMAAFSLLSIIDYAVYVCPAS